MRRASILALPLLFVTPTAFASPESAPTMTAPITYPDTRRVDVVDEQFGEKVAEEAEQ